MTMNTKVLGLLGLLSMSAGAAEVATKKEAPKKAVTLAKAGDTKAAPAKVEEKKVAEAPKAEEKKTEAAAPAATDTADAGTPAKAAKKGATKAK
jgi:hypothetical protein